MSGLGFTEDYITYYPCGTNIRPLTTQAQLATHETAQRLTTPVSTYTVNGIRYRLRFRIEVASEILTHRTGTAETGTRIRRMYMGPQAVIMVPQGSGPIWRSGGYQAGTTDVRAGMRDQATQTIYSYPIPEGWWFNRIEIGDED